MCGEEAAAGAFAHSECRAEGGGGGWGMRRQPRPQMLGDPCTILLHAYSVVYGLVAIHMCVRMRLGVGR